MKRTVILAIVAIASVVFAGCSEDNKVGSGVDLNIKEAADQGRLGQRTTTTAAPTETTAPVAKAGIGAETTTTARPTTTTAAPTTTQQQAPTLEIRINPDTGGVSQFDPSQARVYVGSIVTWTNGDSVARSVKADNGTFDSGPIAPGASFTYRADKVGKFNYVDGTRPYAVAVLEVIPR